MPDGNESIEKSELIYRRVIDNYYNPPNVKPLSQNAFKPLSRDIDGISLTRARYGATPIKVAQSGYVGKYYYVIEFLVEDIESLGVTISPKPVEGDIGHAVIPKINVANATNPEVLKFMNEVRLLTYTAHGPWSGTRPKPTPI